MKTTIDIPEDLLADAMKFTGAKTKRDAVVKAIESFNRLQKIESLISVAGTFANLPTNDELETEDLAYEARMTKRWKAKA
jgi:hypothetical protein